jgi:NAD(P)-dependent dehydrogenase (short-subunit alcohol dehydrogenase family)
MRLKGKVAIVTGGSKGIGAGICEVFCEEGAHCFVLARHTKDIDAKVAELRRAGGKADGVVCDVSKSDSVRAMIDQVVEKASRIDVLVNNAGYHNSKGIEVLIEEDWDFLINTNLKSVFLCTKYALPYLKKSKGVVINMSSMVGLVGQPNACAYAATKGGIIALTKNLAIDLAPYGIRVNVICPGWIQTPLVEEWFEKQTDPAEARRYIYSQHPIGRIGTPLEVGKAALFLATEDSAFTTGSVLECDGGITLGY